MSIYIKRLRRQIWRRMMYSTTQKKVVATCLFSGMLLVCLVLAINKKVPIKFPGTSSLIQTRLFTDHTHNAKDTGSSSQTNSFNLLHLPKGLQNCNRLFNQSEHKFYPKDYWYYHKRFTQVFRKVMKSEKWLEGHVGQVKPQMMLYHKMAQLPFVSTVCEIGFNAGHSTLQWLTGNKGAKVISFDIGKFRYTKKMANYLKSEFPGRFTIFYGDSTLSVPIFTQVDPKTKCDLLIIDGGHTYEVAKKDLKNMKALANPKHHILVFDDYPSKMMDYMSVLGKAWTEMEKDGDVIKEFSCMIFPAKNRGFTLGRYIVSDDIKKSAFTSS